MISINPVTFQFTSAPETPIIGEYPVLVVDTEGKMNESWKVWAQLGRTYAQLTNSFIVEIVGWASLKQNIHYERKETSFTPADEIKDYIPFAEMQ